MVGDEVLFVTDQPADAAEIALRLTSPGRSEQGLPALRVGMAAGRVLNRFGDVYGPVVNLAARLTSLARPGTALVDAELAGRCARRGTTGSRPGARLPYGAITTFGPGRCDRHDSAPSLGPGPATAQSSAPGECRPAAMLAGCDGTSRDQPLGARQRA
jgi:adenylate cyclase